MRITYLMINADVVCGGNRTVFGQVNGLIERGHDVRVLSLYGNKPFIPLKTKVINVPHFKDTVPSSDIVVAAFNVRALPLYHPKNEIPFHLVLVYETLYWPEDPSHQRICDLLYLSPINLLCNSKTLQELFKERLHRYAYWIPHGVNLEQFKPREGILSGPEKRVLMIYRSGATKGMEDGLNALRIVKNRCPEVEVVMVGSNEIDIPRGDFPFTFFFDPSQQMLSAIYSSCDIFILPSHLEGFPRTRLEAMACGVAVVTTDCLGGGEMIRDGETALVVPPRDPKAMAEAIIRLLKDESLRKRIAENGYKKAQEFTWERSIDALEDTFKRVEELKRKRSFEKMGRWEKVVATSPDDPWAHYQVGIELYKKGRRGDAEAEFKRAARLDPSFTLPQEAFSLLREGREDFPQDWESLEGSLVVQEKVIR
jgi:glycosyltransferase involved in cell wall biosynthesis